MNTKLLEELFYRIVKLFDDYSDLKIRINNLSSIELIFPNIADVIEFWPRTVLDDERKSKFLSSLHSNMFDFLFKHTESNELIDDWTSLSIFRMCNVFDVNLSGSNRLAVYFIKELGKSKAAETIRNIGYCDSLEELALRMDLIGI